MSATAQQQICIHAILLGNGYQNLCINQNKTNNNFFEVFNQLTGNEPAAKPNLTIGVIKILKTIPIIPETMQQLIILGRVFRTLVPEKNLKNQKDSKYLKFQIFFVKKIA